MAKGGVRNLALSILQKKRDTAWDTHGTAGQNRLETVSHGENRLGTPILQLNHADSQGVPLSQSQGAGQWDSLRSASKKVGHPLGQHSPNTRVPIYDRVFTALRERCPDHVHEPRWRLAIDDAHRFLTRWGEQAEALGWTTRELFGLHEVPVNPSPSNQRLSRHDQTGLVWLLQGCPVMALTQTTAAIRMPSGSVLTYRKRGKPALGPLGNSIDDFECAGLLHVAPE